MAEDKYIQYFGWTRAGYSVWQQTTSSGHLRTAVGDPKVLFGARPSLLLYAGSQSVGLRIVTVRRRTAMQLLSARGDSFSCVCSAAHAAVSVSAVAACYLCTVLECGY